MLILNNAPHPFALPRSRLAHPQTVSLGLANLGLQQRADHVTGTDSGGNKQELAAVLALLGDPAVVFLVRACHGLGGGGGWEGQRQSYWGLPLPLPGCANPGVDPGARCFLCNCSAERPLVVLTSPGRALCPAPGLWPK